MENQGNQFSYTIKYPFYLSAWFIVLGYIFGIVPGILLTVARSQYKKQTLTPLFKNIALGIFALFFVATMGNALISGGSKPTAEANTPKDTSSEVAKNEAKKEPEPEVPAFYQVGDVVTVSSSKKEPQYTVTITNVYETDSRNQFSEKQADRVVVIEYSYENIAKDSGLFVSELNLKTYDASGTSMDTYPAVVSAPSADTIGVGRNSSGHAVYALNNESGEFELELFDNMFDSKPVATWKLSI